MQEASSNTTGMRSPAGRPVVVTLTSGELHLAATVEILRRTQNIEVGRRPAYGAQAADWTSGVEGAAAEMAVAKHLGRYWSGNLGDLKAADVGLIQVRSTSHANGCLLLHPKDSDDDVFILVVGVAPAFRLVGWIRGRDGKRPDYWRDPTGNRPAFFVPQGALRPMSQRRTDA